MRIAIDIDGVLYNWEKTGRFLLRQYWGYHLEESESWSYIPDHVSKEAWDWLWTKGIKEGLFRYGHVVRGAPEGVKMLAAAGHELVAVTHRPVGAIKDTHEWLDLMFPWFKERHILHDGRSKATVGGDLLIDDKPQNVTEWIHSRPYAILLRQPWNREISSEHAGPFLWVARAWWDIYRIVHHIDWTRNLPAGTSVYSARRGEWGTVNAT